VRSRMVRNRLKNLEADRRVMLIFVILSAIGVYLVASSSSFFSAAKFSNPYFLIKNHLLRLTVAMLFFVAAVRVDYRLYRKPAVAVYLTAVVLLIGLFVAGHPIRGSAKWYHIKSIHATLQPSEAARLALILFLSYWIARTGRDFTDFKRGFLPAAGAVLLVVGLMAAQPDFGTAGATMLIALVVMFVGGARIMHLAAFACAAALPVAVKIWSEDYARERLMAFLKHGESLREANWQVYQSLIGLGSGGIHGIGFGKSMQKLNWLPDSHTDFIFSILGEELGIVGTVLVSGLFLLLALRALKIARRCGDVFGEMLAVGIGSSIFIYAALNMAVATGMLPVTGLPLPFISYGGTALVINSIAVGILINVGGGRRISSTPRKSVRSRRLRCAAQAS